MTDAASVRAALAGDYLRRYPGEVAALLEAQPDAAAAVFEREPPASAAPVFAAVTPAAAAHMLAELSDARAAELLRALDPAQAAALCARLAEDEQRRILDRLPDAEAHELRELMAYPADSAAGLMNTRVETFRPEVTAGNVLARLRAARVDGVTDVALVDADGRLAGMASIAALAASEPGTAAAQLVRGAHVAVRAITPREEVVEMMTRTGVGTLPVVDADDRLLGVVRHERLAPAIKEDASAGAQTMVGAGDEERGPVAGRLRRPQAPAVAADQPAHGLSGVGGRRRIRGDHRPRHGARRPAAGGGRPVRQHGLPGACRDHSRSGIARGAAAALAPRVPPPLRFVNIKTRFLTRAT